MTKIGKIKRAGIGLGLVGLVAFNQGCATTGDAVTDVLFGQGAQALSTQAYDGTPMGSVAGTVLGVAGSGMIMRGQLEAQKEVAREGRSEVNVYNQTRLTSQNIPSVETYGCEWVDLNRNGKREDNENVPLRKNIFPKESYFVLITKLDNLDGAVLESCTINPQHEVENLTSRIVKGNPAFYELTGRPGNLKTGQHYVRININGRHIYNWPFTITP